MVCRSCNHIGRNAYQVNNHASLTGHSRECDQILLSQKRAFTCSNHDKIYYDAERFLHHFQNDSRCSLNHFDGNFYHHERVCTLLQEGKSQSGQHKNSINVYDAVLKHCRQYGVAQTDWMRIVYAHSSDTARALADRLEWGLIAPDGSALSRLGYADLSEMVARVLTPSGDDHVAIRPEVAKPLPKLPGEALPLGGEKSLPSLESSYSSTPADEFPDMNDWSIPDDFNTWMAGLAADVEGELMLDLQQSPRRLQKQPSPPTRPCVESPAVIAAGEMLREAHLIASPRRGIIRAKRPTSIISDIHPEALARQQNRRNVNELTQTGVGQSESVTPDSARPGSGESMGALFDLRGYYGGTPPLPTPRQAQFNNDNGSASLSVTIRVSPAKTMTALPSIPGHTKTPPGTPRSGKDKARGLLKIFTSPNSKDRSRENEKQHQFGAAPENECNVTMMHEREDRTQKRQGGVWDHWLNDHDEHSL